ncbi:MAG: membrane protein insertion efficiency factor YidD [Burkholderiaceae bacterium]
MSTFGALHRAVIRFAQFLIRAYQLTIRVVLGPRCRFLPTCSDYAHEALESYGLWHGGRMTVSRLCRCRPGGGSGYDPVSRVQGPPAAGS